jgi:hypothetical protein
LYSSSLDGYWFCFTKIWACECGVRFGVSVAD